MSYPLSPSDFPSLTQLSLTEDPRRPAPQSSYNISSYGMPSEHHYDNNQAPWFVPGWQLTLDAASNPPFYSSATFETALWNPMLPPYPPKAAAMGSLFLPRLSLAELDLPPSPSDTCSSVYSELSPSPPPSLHVTCDLPVIAPRPLPYHSPTFLQFDLPDINEDLSHPPYVRGPNPKRKRDAADDNTQTSAKRHAAAAPYAPAVQARAARAARRQTRW